MSHRTEHMLLQSRQQFMQITFSWSLLEYLGHELLGWFWMNPVWRFGRCFLDLSPV